MKREREAGWKRAAAYQSVNDVYLNMSDEEFAQTSTRFEAYQAVWERLHAGDRVPRNQFHFETTTCRSSQPMTLIGNHDAAQLVVNIDGQHRALMSHVVYDTNLVLVEDLLRTGMNRRIGHVRDIRTGKERAVRNQFYRMSEAQNELQAITVLASYGYPVPKNPTLHQFFLPWIDTLTYDWIPGENVGSALVGRVASHDHEGARRVITSFAQHLTRVWKPLLEHPLPNRSGYLFPDNVLGNFIYTGNSESDRAFVRIDIGQLASAYSTRGTEDYRRQIIRELYAMQEVQSCRDELIRAFDDHYGR